MGFLNTIAKAVRPLVSDSMRDWGAKEYFNRRYNSIGRMTHLHIDSVKKTVTMDLDLKGEVQPLHITIEDYVLTSEGGKNFLEIKKLTTSREWLNLAAGELFKGRKFEVPEILKTVL